MKEEHGWRVREELLEREGARGRGREHMKGNGSERKRVREGVSVSK